MGSLKKFYFNGKSSLDFNAWTFGGGTYVKPKKVVEKIPVAGRNGDVILEDNKFENVTIVYPVIINKNFRNNFDNLMAFLLSTSGYKKLEDDYFPDHFRMGTYYDDVEPKVRIHNDVGKFELTFDCKPQKFLREGQKTVEIIDGTINNPTQFECAPLIRAYGIGAFTVNGTVCEIHSSDDWVDIDSETMECFREDVNWDDRVYIPDFPMLKAGKNEISCDGIQRLEITPRYWTI